MSDTNSSPFAATTALETLVPGDEDFAVRTMAAAPAPRSLASSQIADYMARLVRAAAQGDAEAAALLNAIRAAGGPSRVFQQAGAADPALRSDITALLGAPASLPAPATGALDTLSRVYTPPAPGSFDPLTASISGNIPSFFGYRQRVTPQPDFGGGGGGDGDGGGGGTGGGGGGGGGGTGGGGGGGTGGGTGGGGTGGGGSGGGTGTDTGGGGGGDGGGGTGGGGGGGGAGGAGTGTGTGTGAGGTGTGAGTGTGTGAGTGTGTGAGAGTGTGTGAGGAGTGTGATGGTGGGALDTLPVTTPTTTPTPDQAVSPSEPVSDGGGGGQADTGLSGLPGGTAGETPPSDTVATTGGAATATGGATGGATGAAGDTTDMGALADIANAQASQAAANQQATVTSPNQNVAAQNVTTAAPAATTQPATTPPEPAVTPPAQTPPALTEFEVVFEAPRSTTQPATSPEDVDLGALADIANAQASAPSRNMNVEQAQYSVNQTMQNAYEQAATAVAVAQSLFDDLQRDPENRDLAQQQAEALSRSQQLSSWAQSVYSWGLQELSNIQSMAPQAMGRSSAGSLMGLDVPATPAAPSEFDITLGRISAPPPPPPDVRAIGLPTTVPMSNIIQDLDPEAPVTEGLFGQEEVGALADAEAFSDEDYETEATVVSPTGTLSNINAAAVSPSISGGLRGASIGSAFAGPAGAVIGGLIGAFGPTLTQTATQRTDLTPAELHARAVEAMAGGMDAQAAATAAEEAAMAAGTQSPTFGTGSYGFGTDPGRGGSGDFGAMSAAERGESVGPPGGETNTTSPGDNSTSAGAPSGEASTSGGDMGGGPSGDSGDGYKEGGLVQFAKGGLVPLAGGGKIAVGPGGGLDDLIPTSINGRRAAALSDGEFVIPSDVVSMLGDGSSNAGARRLYDLMRQIRNAKTGTTRQAGPLPVGEILKRSLGR